MGPRAVDLIGGIADSQAYDPIFGYIDFVQVPDASYELDGRHWAVYAHDWRRHGVDGWFAGIADRELEPGAGPAEQPPGRPAPIALSQPDFAAAVRDALRNLHRPDRLRRNPLRPDWSARPRPRRRRRRWSPPFAPRSTRSRQTPGPKVSAASCTGRTPARPRPRSWPAEALCLPFSTYRRHLARGTEEVVARLWERELYGPPSLSEQETGNGRPGN